MAAFGWPFLSHVFACSPTRELLANIFFATKRIFGYCKPFFRVDLVCWVKIGGAHVHKEWIVCAVIQRNGSFCCRTGAADAI